MNATPAMRRCAIVSLLLVCLVAPASARQETAVCGTTRETPAETLFLHRQSVRARGSRVRPFSASPAAVSGTLDIGNIAVIEDSDGVVARQNQFNLDSNTLTFTPSAPNAASYRYSVAPQGYDPAAASAGTPLAALDDDDSRQVALPFAFPFFGATYQQVFVNSDGNLTFTAGDSASTDRSLGRMTAGPPRISPLFDDLDPSQTAGGVRVLADATRVVVSWVKVPEWAQSGTTPLQTFQVRLYPDGRVEFSYSGATPTSAIVGIAPGNLKGSTTLVDFRNDPSGDYSAAVAERFGDTVTVDIVTLAQKFYRTHEDSYDYLVVYNNESIPALNGGTVAYENTVRSSGTGYGVSVFDTGTQYGSPTRLQAMINMGPLSQYPADPSGAVPARAPQHDTPLTILGHETGHLFLAYASVHDPVDPTASPMLGYANVHWSFLFDSEASLLEGERILDLGPSASPRFQTTDITQGYAPLDQFLMGFRPSSDVPDTFYVAGPSPPYAPTSHQLSGVSFNGTKQVVRISDVIQAVGRRTPDCSVAQRRFRFAFILVVPQGTSPSAATLTQVDTYRQQFEAFYATASSGNATADTTIRRSMKLSLFPAAGVVAGAAGSAAVTLQTAPSSDMAVQFQAPNGYARFPASVTVPAGATSVSFAVAGLKPGVEDVLTTPGDPTYETAAVRVQVADASMLKLVALSGDRQVAASSGPLPNPIVVRLTDSNNLPYAGMHIAAAPGAGGTVDPVDAVTDAQGQASFRWTPGQAPVSQLTLALANLPAVSLTVSAGSAVPVITAVVNAASFESGMAAGSLQTIFGANLSAGQTARAAVPWPTTLGGVRVLLSGSALPLLYASDTQINFYVPLDTPLGAATITAVIPSGSQASASVNVALVEPGIFAGAILHAGTGISAVTTPVHAGDYLEIYCTGLGPATLSAPTVFIGATPLKPLYSGPAPGLVGLYQVNVQVPQGLSPGAQPVIIELNLTHSNQIDIMVN
jgi:uncharacterized protein (TIGR03437 family)